jgi:phosphoribosylformylglycinamidine synthase subunit PurS
VKATVLVRPKQGIRDPQGEAIEGSLRKLGFKVSQVRVGRLIDFELVAEGPGHARLQVERMCSELLANPLIESVQISLGDATDSPGRESGA